MFANAYDVLPLRWISTDPSLLEIPFHIRNIPLPGYYKFNWPAWQSNISACFAVRRERQGSCRIRLTGQHRDQMAGGVAARRPFPGRSGPRSFDQGPGFLDRDVPDGQHLFVTALVRPAVVSVAQSAPDLVRGQQP